LPTPPLNAGDRFTITFELVNKDEREDMRVDVKLFDYGLCNATGLLLTEWTELGGVYNKTYDLSPLETDFIEWSFQAPGNEKIAYLTAKCPIRFKVSYDYYSTSQVVVGVINHEERMRRLRAGQTITFVPNQTIGRGPIKIYFDFGASLPVVNNTFLPVFLTVEDKGTGLLGEIKNETLLIEFPSPDFSKEKPCDWFGDIESSEKSDYNLIKNNQDITMIKRKSPLIRCSFEAPNVDIEQTYFFYSTIYYSYDLTYEVDVQVKPLLGV